MSLVVDMSVWYAAADAADVRNPRAKEILFSGEAWVTTDDVPIRTPFAGPTGCPAGPRPPAAGASRDPPRFAPAGSSRSLPDDGRSPALSGQSYVYILPGHTYTGATYGVTEEAHAQRG